MTLEQKIVDFLVIQHGHSVAEAESAVATLLPEILANRISQALADEKTKEKNRRQWSKQER